ncbi:hypothetical protein N4P33_21195 [Streptomyces sp. 15-116A]|uniref:hypothetical protein n=1 Tax=Streptomyces sp. 15-116A TaxID=2259035 RepID=UPI0021B45615|nr:hypothetical protein [Streptomyces sp. 15-116A]MCT7354654.1 hypothetical protein [Streptomyces sp. 15-116A]
MSLVERIAQADELGLAVSGLACLDRCVPLLGGDDEVLRPLWAALSVDAAPGDWPGHLALVRDKLDQTAGADEAVTLAHRMLTAAPADRSAGELRPWADACSVAALRIHRLLDGADPAEDRAGTVDAPRAGRTDGMSPLVAAELRRQITVLEVLSGHGPAGLRRALEVTTEGRRVLRAALSRRSRRDTP